MFWKKDFWTGTFGYKFPREYPMWKNKELATKEDIIALERKFDLILGHLKLQYVPESEKKEPAKLVEKQEFNISSIWDISAVASTGGSGATTTISIPTQVNNTSLSKKKPTRSKKK